jgi:hypothetical protein
MKRPNRNALDLAGQHALFAETGRIPVDPTLQQLLERLGTVKYRRLTPVERVNIQRAITSRLPTAESEYEQPEDVPEDEHDDDQGSELRIVAELGDGELLACACCSFEDATK